MAIEINETKVPAPLLYKGNMSGSLYLKLNNGAGWVLLSEELGPVYKSEAEIIVSNISPFVGEVVISNV